MIAVLQKGAVAASGGVAVYCRGIRPQQSWCTSKGRAELAGCALSGGTGLYVEGGATAEVQGGSIADCGLYGVLCDGSGSKATVRTARPRTAETARYLRARW